MHGPHKGKRLTVATFAGMGLKCNQIQLFILQLDLYKIYQYQKLKKKKYNFIEFKTISPFQVCNKWLLCICLCGLFDQVFV